MSRLIASMIVKNELNRYLPLAVEHMLTYVDEVRVLDDGSDDGTYEWLEEREKVEVLRNPGPAFFTHEGRARQQLLEWTLQGRPDFVLAIDADEFVGNPEAVTQAVEQQTPVAILKLVEAWKVDVGGISIRVDGHWGPRKCPILYMAPRRTDRGWSIPDRQLASGREPISVIRASRRAPVLETEIFHFGWTRVSERQARAERYFKHDGGKFHADRHLQSILFGDDKVLLKGIPWPVALRPISADLIEYSRAA